MRQQQHGVNKIYDVPSQRRLLPFIVPVFLPHDSPRWPAFTFTTFSQQSCYYAANSLDWLFGGGGLHGGRGNVTCIIFLSKYGNAATEEAPWSVISMFIVFLSCSSDLFTWFMPRLNSSLSVQKLSRVHRFCCTEASEAFKYAPCQVGSNTQHPAVIKVLTHRAIDEVTQVTQRENAHFFGGEYVFKIC